MSVNVLTKPKSSPGTFRELRTNLQKGLRDRLTPIVSLHAVTLLTGTPKKIILEMVTRRTTADDAQTINFCPTVPSIFSAIKVSRTGEPIEELFIPLELAVELFGFPAIPPPTSNLLSTNLKEEKSQSIIT